MSEKNDTIKKAAEKGWNTYAQANVDEINAKSKTDKATVRKFDELNSIETFGLLQAVTSILADPYAEPYAGLMPANHDRKAYRALDDCLRDALGYSRFNHA